MAYLERPNTWPESNEFDELKKLMDLGDLTDITTARLNLGLGNSAVLNVGTEAETVAAGDHEHDFNELDLPVTKLIYADINRTDTYTADGSFTKPFKTMTAAAAACVGGECIVFTGEFAESVSIPSNVSLMGYGPNVSKINGGLIVAGGNNSIFQNFHAMGQWTINGNSTIINIHSRNVIANSGNVNAYAWNIEAVSNSALVWGSSGTLAMFGGRLSVTGQKVINQTAGIVALSNVSVLANDSGNAAIDSSGGVLKVYNSKIENSPGETINISNSASETLPNVISEVESNGDIVVDTSYIRIAYINFISGALTATNIIYTPASGLKNDSSVTGNTVKDALEALLGGGGGGGTILGESQLYYTSVKVTPAELNLLNSNPKELIPAPGEGKAIIITDTNMTMLYGTTPHTATSELSLSYADDPANNRFCEFPSWSVRNIERDSVVGRIMSFGSGYMNNPANVNDSVVLYCPYADDPAQWDGDSDIYIHMLYKIIDIDFEGTVEPGESAATGIQTARVTVTPSELNNPSIYGVVKEIIPAQGSGKIINIVGAIAFLDYSTTPYSSSTHILLHSGGDDTEWYRIHEGSDLWSSTNSIGVPFSKHESPYMDAINQDICLRISGGSGQFPSGDSNLIIVVKYYIEDING